MMSNGSAIKQCADCGQTAHTSITCKNGKVGTINLFGVTVNPKGDQVDDIHQLDDDDDGDTVRECRSMEIINLCSNENTFMDHGYYSDEQGHGNGKKKGATWTRKEHKLFLIGLEKLGKGDWKGISKEYVKSRTSTQVASHAQKYFLRVNSPQENGRRRSSLFDMPVNELVPASPIPPPTPIAPPTQVATHTPLAHPTPMAPPTNCVRAPVPRTSQNYGVRDYSYMPLGFPNSNKKPYSHRHFSPTVSFLPVMSFPNQNCAYPYNANWNQRFITLSPVTHPPPITQGEPMIIEVIDDDE